MPKGVEHTDTKLDADAGGAVKGSVMPKGVEHDIKQRISDAERR
jgi:hypothetical protein